MVYVKDQEKQEKKPRKSVEMRLASVTTDAKAVIKVEGSVDKFQYIDLAGTRVIDGETIWFNVRVSGGRSGFAMNDLPELEKADNLLREKKHPKVLVSYYESKKVVSQGGEDKIYTNLRANDLDIKNDFKILEDDVERVGGEGQVALKGDDKPKEEEKAEAVEVVKEEKVE